MSESLESPYAFVKTCDDYEPGESPDTILQAEAGLCWARETEGDAEIEVKLATASFKVGKVGMGVGTSAQAESASISGSSSHSMDVGDHTIDFKTEVSAKGPSVGAEAELALTGVGAKVKAELASASGSVGVVGGKLGLAVDTGVALGLDGVEVTMLGTGFSLWPNTSVTVLGSGVSIDTRTAVNTILSWF